MAQGWFSSEADVHLRIWLADVVFDYTATAAAARNLIHDWGRKHWCTIELIRDTVVDGRLLPRLPCERLFLGPGPSAPRCPAGQVDQQVATSFGLYGHTRLGAINQRSVDRNTCVEPAAPRSASWRP